VIARVSGRDSRFNLVAPSAAEADAEGRRVEPGRERAAQPAGTDDPGVSIPQQLPKARDASVDFVEALRPTMSSRMTDRQQRIKTEVAAFRICRSTACGTAEPHHGPGLPGAPTPQTGAGPVRRTDETCRHDDRSLRFPVIERDSARP
jgi:hypothetical protein